MDLHSSTRFFSGADDSLLSVFQGEFKVTERTMSMKELLKALDAGRVLEMFGAGTACVVCPVSGLLYRGKVAKLL